MSILEAGSTSPESLFCQPYQSIFARKQARQSCVLDLGAPKIEHEACHQNRIGTYGIRQIGPSEILNANDMLVKD
jgi:hypothetical protein